MPVGREVKRITPALHRYTGTPWDLINIWIWIQEGWAGLGLGLCPEVHTPAFAYPGLGISNMGLAASGQLLAEKLGRW